jgi:glycosyltransferase involved in cell wall biosynthesis
VPPEQVTTEAVDVWSAEFPGLCARNGIEVRALNAAEAEISEAFAAHFIIAVLRQSGWLRWRFPRALADGARGGFAKWIETAGARRFGLSEAALKKIRGVFRRPPGARLRDVYLRDRELQRLYPLGLVPAGQGYFLPWLTTHGRADQNLQDHEILWFLHESAEAVGDGVALAYAVNPAWQEKFPDALTAAGWRSFRDELTAQFPALHRWRGRLRNVPALKQITPPARTGANILSHFCYPSGIQQAALWAKAALEASGAKTSCRDVPVALRAEFLDRRDWLGLESYPFTINNVAPTPYFASAYARSGLLRRPGVYRIAYWAWELEMIPDEWLEVAPFADEIWAPTEFVAKAMRSRMPLPVFEMLPGVEVGRVEPVSRAELGIAEDHCVFLFMFDMYSELERKNPLAVIRAFQQAFGAEEKASLVIKVSRGNADPEGLRRLESAAREAAVLLVDRVVSRELAYGFLDLCDCFVSLHRSEGFGLGLAEAMLLGKPTIATRYSGNLAFMHPENSLLVDYTLADIVKSGPIYQKGAFWAEPAVEHAASLMRWVFGNRDDAATLGRTAQGELRAKLSLRAAGERMLSRLRQISDSRKA